MKTFRDFLEEAAEHKELHKFAQDEYQRVAYDLPRSGTGHHSAAHDHVTDRMFEKFHGSHPKTDFRKETKKALKGWVDDDRKETRSYEKKQDRKWAAASKPPKEKKSKIPTPWWKKAGYSSPLTGRKPRKGIGSY